MFLGICHGNTKACRLDHGQIVFTVPNGNDFHQRHTGFFCCFLQGSALADTGFHKFQILRAGEEMVQFSRNERFHFFPHRIQLFIGTAEEAFGKIAFIFQSIQQYPHIRMHDTAIGLHLRGHFFRNKRTVIIEIDFYPFFSGDFHHRAQVVRRKGMFQHHFHILQVIHSGAVLADDITWTTQEMQFFQKPFHTIDTTTGANDKFHTLIHCFSNHFYIFFRKF